jgi:adenylosuccinate synthase
MNSDFIVRYQGGNNAGHTIQIKDQIHKLHLVPSGVFYNKDLVIGNGVVVDPDVLIKEIEELTNKGYTPKLHLSDRAHIIFPYHIEMDKVVDQAQGKMSAGSTKRGIGPVYSDKSAREGIRFCDLVNGNLTGQLQGFIDKKQKVFSNVYDSEVKLDSVKIHEKVKSWSEELSPYIKDTGHLLYDAMKKGKSILFEGAQATFLDVDHGIYPFSTSSNPTIGGAFTGSGVFSKNIKSVGIVKAYLTRVGNGPVVTELLDKSGEILREKGGEYGTTTGRPRRCGWLDLVMVNYAKRINNLDSLALTKLDVLSGMSKIKICIAYQNKDRILKSIPARILDLEGFKPIYVEFEGWIEDISKIRHFDQLPNNAKAFVNFIETEVELPIDFIGVGKERDDLIVRKNI